MNVWLELAPIVADRGWSSNNGKIRSRDGECPVCAIVNEIIGFGYYATFAWGAVQELSPLPVGARINAFALVRAADMPSHPLRKQLMHALGII